MLKRLNVFQIDGAIDKQNEENIKTENKTKLNIK